MSDSIDGSHPPLHGTDLRELVDRIPATIMVLANRSTASILYVSAQIERLTGYATREWIEDSDLWTRSIHPADRDRFADAWAAAVALGATFAEEFRLITRDGSIVWVGETAEPMRDADGRVVSWQGIAYDITSRLAAEDALSRSEARYRALVERLPAVVYVDSDDVRPRSLYVSPNSEEVLGFAPAKYLADSDLWTRSIHPDDRSFVAHAWASVIGNRQPFHQVYRMVRPDGETIWVRDSSIPVRDEGGSTLFWQGVMLDITQQDTAEEELRLSEARYRLLVEQVPAVVYEMDRDDERRTLYVSPHVEEILGYSRQEWLDQPDIWTELLHEDDREIELAAHDRHTETGEPWSREYRLIASDGRVVWVRDQARLIRNRDPDAARWQGVMLDITFQKDAERALRDANDELEFGVLARTTELADANELMTLEIGERRRVEAELREAETRYRLLVEDLPAFVYTWDADRDDHAHDPSEHVYLSPQIETILGFSPAEWEQDGFWTTRLHPHDRDRVIAAERRSARTGQPFNVECRYLAKDGRVVWVLDRATLRTRNDEGRPWIFQGLMLDITARKSAEQKVTEVEARYKLLAEGGPLMSYIYDLDQDVEAPAPRIDYVSPQTAAVVGYPLERWVGEPLRWFEMVHPDDRERLERGAAAVWASGEPWSTQYRMIAEDGRIVWLRDQGNLVARDGQGRPCRFQGVLLDITPEREHLGAVERSERAFRAIVESAPAVAWTEVVDVETGRSRFTYIGPQSTAMLGYSPRELMDEPGHFERLLHPEDRHRALASSAVSDRTLEPWDEEFRVITRDGRQRILHASARAEPVDPSTHTVTWYGITVDVTPARSSASSPVRARAGTGAASPAAPPSRPPAGGSPSAR